MIGPCPFIHCQQIRLRVVLTTMDLGSGSAAGQIWGGPPPEWTSSPPRNAGEVSWTGNTLSHSHFSQLQPPRENERQRRRSHGVPILKYLHLAPSAPLLSLAAAGSSLSFFVQIWPAGSGSWSLPWTFSLTSLLPLPHSLTDSETLLFFLSLCESQWGRLEAAVAVWPHFIDVQRVMTS